MKKRPVTLCFSVIDVPGTPGRRGDLFDLMVVVMFMQRATEGSANASPETWTLMQELVEPERQKFRAEHAGTRVTVTFKQDHAAVIGEALRAGLPLPAAFKRAGVSRATGYRVLRQQSKKDLKAGCLTFHLNLSAQSGDIRRSGRWRRS